MPEIVMKEHISKNSPGAKDKLPCISRHCQPFDNLLNVISLIEVKENRKEHYSQPNQDIDQDELYEHVAAPEKNPEVFHGVLPVLIFAAVIHVSFLADYLFFQ
jgi:hypothetical protein